MLTKRRSSFASSTSSSLAKRSSSSSENMTKVVAPAAQLEKKRPALSNLSNREIGSQIRGKSSLSSGVMVPCRSNVSNAKKRSSCSVKIADISGKALLPSSNPISTSILPPTKISNGRSDSVSNSMAIPLPCSIDTSPSKSDESSVAMDESMSTCNSLNFSEFEYKDVSAVSSLDRTTLNSLSISEYFEHAGNFCDRDAIMDMETDDENVNIDDRITDPQMCATLACDIYKHLRASEAKKRPSIDFMERIQKEVTSSMRAILVDWLVEVSEEYKLVPDTLYLTVNYIDRYLSGNIISRQKLQLLGVACMMIAAKYEEICAPHLEEFCYITDNTYFKEEVLEMESAVLNYLKFEMTAPTAKCFLRRFVRAAQGTNEVFPVHLEYTANYIAELSLVEYNMLRYPPSLIAASSIFLANYILFPSSRPWNSTLEHYTQFCPSDLRECVKALHRLLSASPSSKLPAVREKYSQHKYKFVAKKNCPDSIPLEFFQNFSD